MLDSGGKKKGKDLSFLPLAWDTMQPIDVPLVTFFAPTRHDIFLSALSVLSVISVWIVCARSSGFNKVFTFWDCAHFLIATKLAKSDHFQDPFPELTGSRMSENITPLRLHHTIVRGFCFVTFGSAKYGQMFYVLVLSAASTCLFFRLLRAYGFASHSFYITVLFIFFPIRFFLFRALPTYDSLFLSLIFLALILYRIDQPVALCCAVGVACCVRFEAALLFALFAACYGVARRRSHAVLCSGLFVVSLLVIAIFFPGWARTVVPGAITTAKELKDRERFCRRPFEFFLVHNSISNLKQVHALHMVYFPAIFGSVLLLFQAMPLAAFGFVYIGFLSFVQSLDMDRFAIPVHAIGLLIGCHFFLAEKLVRFVISCAVPVAFFCELYYCSQQIKSRQMIKIMPLLNAALQ
jgi:hypothetical protein